MKEQRPPIPDPIAREVRQRCGFGCVVCGCPIYDYEHMLEWSKVKRHVASEITLLCPTHHRAKTARRLPSFIVEEANKNPFNYRKGLSTPDILYYSGNSAIVKMGDSSFYLNDVGLGGHMIPLMVKQFPVIEVNLKDQHFFVNMNLLDERNNVILIIKNNVMQYSVGIWDIEYIGRRLIIRQRQRAIFVDIEFEIPNIINFKRGKFYFNGNSFKITNEGLIVNDLITLSRVTMSDIHVGICL
ncbi:MULTISPECIES: HNH endonuclease signature motif containing protein [unclassified Chryseobacterium]|uniref:HNH endonuclease signature motif containing protein n=1 Tax=unclassified Chryseobacterium TaxID=2593645 RepID=UPI000D354ADF|nr:MULTISPECIES: HNH endonuclease signature motif containing protein [unclassified Chryseobacterium]PTT72209.1 cell division protein [Chryseobacterium sp. HMWF001]PVV49378.1 HNH endonuclease [Chryseobacterium sp. HMWF035]